MSLQRRPALSCLRRVLVTVAVLLPLCGTVATAAGKDESPQQLPIVDLGNQRYQVGQIVVDKAGQRFTVSGRFIEHERQDMPIEYLAVVPNGMKSYETLLELDAGAREFNLACILIGLDARNAVLPRFHFDPEPTQGDPVELSVSWEAEGQTVTRTPGEFFSTGGTTLAEDWVYTGSMLTPKGTYRAESMGLLISFAHEPASIIEHRTGIRGDAYRSIQVNRALMPPPGTPVTLTLSRPATVTAAQGTKSTDVVKAGTPPGVPAVAFTDITREAGIDFTHVNGAYGEKLLPQTMGGGVAFLDYDNDGDQDLLFINSGYWPGHVPEKVSSPLQALYRNDGSGHFEDVTREAGLDVSLYGMGAAVGDYDNDGWVDVYITAVGENRLYRNDSGRFRDVTVPAKVAGMARDWSTAAAFLDYDNDGDLDLFVANYMEWSHDLDVGLGQAHRYARVGSNRAYLMPNYFKGAHPYLYRNDKGAFTDVSKQGGVQVAGARGFPLAKALGVVPVDIDRDGWLDLVIANDKVTNFCLRNQRDGTFSEEALALGLGFDANGTATSAMGIDAAYFANDTRLAVAVGNYAFEMDSLFVSRDKPLMFIDQALAEGIGAPTREPLTFGLFFFDYDLDGRLDFLQANGHLEEEIAVHDKGQTYAQPTQLFWNCGTDCKTRYEEVTGQKRGDLATPVVGRGASYADIDGDGDLDVAIAQIAGPPLLLRNDQQLGHHWLRVKLVGHRSNRDAIGARLELVAGGVTQRRQVMPTRSYLSQVELPVTFGLGDARAVQSLTVTWPDGQVQRVRDVPVDSSIVVTQEK